MARCVGEEGRTTRTSVERAMEVIRDVESCPRPESGTAVTIGAFDGVHLGHRAVIASLREVADERGLQSAVVTFDRHPASVVRPESAPLLLTDLDQKLELLAECGVDYTLVVRFDEVRAKEAAPDFVEEVLVGCLNASLVAVGEDFHFGHRRSGNVALLEQMGADLGFDVVGHRLVGLDDAPDAAPVSSTRIRAALRDGEIDAATEMLGRPHEVRGTVGHGDARARDLGFRTANLDVPETICLPADGVYAGWYLTPDGVAHPSAMNLGRRPTFYEQADRSLLEAHLLDFDADLYGQPARVQFVRRLRDELKFDSVEALVEQMARDVDDTRALLTGT
jgi:riboflavin kinase/FMN adenylyltransferase